MQEVKERQGGWIAQRATLNMSVCEGGFEGGTATAGTR
jgi:hypothetical protein